MRAHLVQLDVRWEDREANLARTRSLLDAARVDPGDLVLLPELFDVGFTMRLDRACDDHHRTREFLRDLTRDLGCTVQGGRAVRHAPGDRATNRMTVFAPRAEPDPAGPDPAEPLCDYAKVHPFSFGKEHESFVAGDRVLVYPWRGPDSELTVCPAVCYDLRFPELFRRGLLAGAQCYAIGANWPRERHSHWRALVIARAIENQALVLAVNRAGDDPHLSYAGGSLVVGPRGEIIAEAGEGETVLSAVCAPAAVQGWRSVFPAWRDHRLIRPQTPAPGP